MDMVKRVQNSYKKNGISKKEYRTINNYKHYKRYESNRKFNDTSTSMARHVEDMAWALGRLFYDDLFTYATDSSELFDIFFRRISRKYQRFILRREDVYKSVIAILTMITWK